MGTNYYWHEDKKPACKCCEREYDQKVLHIGKSSVGWCFSLHVHPEDGIEVLGDWIRKWNRSGYIEDEYGRIINCTEMYDIITDRSWPSGLERHHVDSVYCLGHGLGTYDYLVGEFS